MSMNKIYQHTLKSSYEVHTHAQGPQGKLPLTSTFLHDAPSGNIFGMTINAGMGWKPDTLANGDILLISTQGGLRKEDGTTVAVGLHNGHFELESLMRIAAEEIKEIGLVPHATFVTDPCDGRCQGTIGMFDSLPYRNDAAIVMRRLMRSLPTRKAIIGIAGCDKGLPAMLMALAGMHDDTVICIPGGVTLAPEKGEDLGTVQTLGVRYANHEIDLDYAARAGCTSCASPGGSCQFLGTASTAQVIAESLGVALTHSALAPSGEVIWKEIGKASARAVLDLIKNNITAKDILTDKAIENAMIVHAAFGGSTNFLLHLPAIAHAAGLSMPHVQDWARINKEVPRLVSVLPIGPVNYPTVDVFLAGGVPEVMLHLRRLGFLHEDVVTVSGDTLKENLDWWEQSERRYMLKKRLKNLDGVSPTEVILSPQKARQRGIGSTVVFPKGNIAPEGSVVKSTAIDPSVIDKDKVFRHTGKAKVFTSERAAIQALKIPGRIKAGDILIVIGGGAKGTGMEETYQLTSALKQLPFGKHVSLITDARFSGVSTGACFGHVGPEALSGGLIGKLQDNDLIEIIVDTVKLEGSLNFIGTESHRLSYAEGAEVLKSRPMHADVKPDAELPEDTRLWAALQEVSGGAWCGCIYDINKILEVLETGKKVLQKTIKVTE